MHLPGGLGELSYCSNIHPGEDWPAVREALRAHLPAVKALAAPKAPMGVGLRLAAVAANTLRAPGARAELRDLFAANDLYLLTINGFPYGPFHGTRVKEDVYQPDWRTKERLTYTNDLTDLLVDLAPAGGFASLSTVPGTFKPLAAGHERRMAEGLIAAAAHMARVEATTGRTIALAIEPEPFCFLETIAETVAFFEQHLFDERGVRLMAELAGLDRNAAAAALPRHLGLCYDVCHAAVEFEDAGQSLQALAAAGIPVHKLQLSAALRVAEVTLQARAALAAFAEPTYLHQVIGRTAAGALVRHVDLPDALARGADADGEEWRVHFHVPIFMPDLEHFTTTQDFLVEVLARHRQAPISPHLEVETYTWDVLPEGYRGVGVDAAIARELSWVREQIL